MAYADQKSTIFCSRRHNKLMQIQVSLKTFYVNGHRV